MLFTLKSIPKLHTAPGMHTKYKLLGSVIWRRHSGNNEKSIYAMLDS